MPVQPKPRLVRLVPVLLASLGLGTLAEAPAQAQAGQGFSCRTGQLATLGGSDVRPVPRILRYAVAPGTEQAPVGMLRETRDATVTGGDATRGWVRIDVQFDTAIPRDCILPLSVALAADRGNPNNLAIANQMAEVLDGLEVGAGQSQVMPHLAGALRFEGSGTDMASFRLPIRATSANRTVAHSLKLVLAQDFAGGLPFTVNVAPLPAFSVVPPSGPLAAGAITIVRAEQPVALLPGTAAMPVTFRLSSATLGRWQNGPTSTPAETRTLWDDRFAVLRAEATLVPATLAETATGTISVTFAGRTQTAPVTIAAAAPAAGSPVAACDPVFTVAAVAGGLRLSMTNRGRGGCPAQLVKARMLGKTLAPLSPPQAKLTLPTGLKPAAGPLSPLAGTGASGNVTFTLDKAAQAQLKPGVRFDFDIVAEGAGASAPPRAAGITLTATDLAVIAGRPGK